MKHLRMQLTAVLAVFAAASCRTHFPSREAAGDLGRASFSYTEDGCYIPDDDHGGCYADQTSTSRTMLVGTHESIWINPTQHMTGATVESSDPSVFTVAAPIPACCPLAKSIACSCDSQIPGLIVDVVAVGTGSAQLVVTDAQGALFDRTTLSVASAARLELKTCSTVSISKGEFCLAWWNAYDSAGNLLQATGGVGLATTDPAVANASGGMIWPVSVGSVSLVATATSTTSTADITVVP